MKILMMIPFRQPCIFQDYAFVVSLRVLRMLHTAIALGGRRLISTRRSRESHRSIA